MALDQSALLELIEALSSADDGELMRRLLHTILQALDRRRGVRVHRRRPARAHRGAHHPAQRHPRQDGRDRRRRPEREDPQDPHRVVLPRRCWTPRRRIDVALHAVVMQAYVQGVSTRKVDDLVTALGVESGISKSEVSRICAQLDAEVAALASPALDEQAFPYVFLDATYCKARSVNGRQSCSQAVVIATGVTADGHREVLGCEVGDSETEDVLDRVPPRACATAAWPGSSWSSPTPTAA